MKLTSRWNMSMSRIHGVFSTCESGTRAAPQTYTHTHWPHTTKTGDHHVIQRECVLLYCIVLLCVYLQTVWRSVCELFSVELLSNRLNWIWWGSSDSRPATHTRVLPALLNQSVYTRLTWEKLHLQWSHSSCQSQKHSYLQLHVNPALLTNHNASLFNWSVTCRQGKLPNSGFSSSIRKRSAKKDTVRLTSDLFRCVCSYTLDGVCVHLAQVCV